MTKEPQGWQPIETAPRDGAWIVLWADQWNRCEIGKWDWSE